MRLNLNRNYYRCSLTFNHLSAWLRTKGVAAHKPIHTLRKLFGSLLNDRYGLHVASLGLRHSDISITAQHYVSKRASATVGLGSMIAESSKIVSFDEETRHNTNKEVANGAG
jgi:integrase